MADDVQNIRISLAKNVKYANLCVLKIKFFDMEYVEIQYFVGICNKNTIK